VQRSLTDARKFSPFPSLFTTFPQNPSSHVQLDDRRSLFFCGIRARRLSPKQRGTVAPGDGVASCQPRTETTSGTQRGRNPLPALSSTSTPRSLACQARPGARVFFCRLRRRRATTATTAIHGTGESVVCQRQGGRPHGAAGAPRGGLAAARLVPDNRVPGHGAPTGLYVSRWPRLRRTIGCRSRIL
jgi:hypothetical protein